MGKMKELAMELAEIVEPEVSQPKTQAEKWKVLEGLEKSLNKQFDTTKSLVRLGDKVGVTWPSIATNLPTFDNDVSGTGGIPRGRIIECFGPESSGKTTLCLHICAQEQKSGAIVAYVDAEHALDPTYAAALGVDVDNLVISQPDSGEQALDTVIALVNSGAVSLIVVDSVAALVPRAELEGDMGESHMGLQARLMSQAMRKLRGICAVNSVTVIFINQIREKIGVMFGSPETTTGGRALKFYSSLRLDVRRVGGEDGKLTEKGVLIGHRMKIKAVKNKMSSPFRETICNLIYGKGFDVNSDIIEYALSNGILERAGAWVKFDGKNYRKDDLAEFVEQIKEKIKEWQTGVPLIKQ
jgi:recombination protein RecA